MMDVVIRILIWDGFLCVFIFTRLLLFCCVGDNKGERHLTCQSSLVSLHCCVGGSRGEPLFRWDSLTLCVKACWLYSSEGRGALFGNE